MNWKPIIDRALPFALFVLLTSLQGQWGESSIYWVYILKTFLIAGLLVWLWPRLPELRPVFSWQALAAGVLVFVLWVGLDSLYPKTGELWAKISQTPYQPAPPWNPFDCFGANSPAGWATILTRLLGASLLVPLVEELFYRSFLYRFMIKEKFEQVSLNHFSLIPFLSISVLFGFVHQEWLSGILCGLIYQGLVCWKGRLGDAITAHGITNLLLGLWVIWRGAWNFW